MDKTTERIIMPKVIDQVITNNNMSRFLMYGNLVSERRKVNEGFWTYREVEETHDAASLLEDKLKLLL